MKVVTKTGLHLALGKKIMITLRGEKYQVGLRGWVEDEYLIVDYPVFQGDYIKIAPLTGCSLSFTSDGTYFDFKTLVLYSVAQPVRLMILEYPKSFTSYKLRRNNRHKANFPFSFTMEGDALNTSFKGTIRDLSLSGVLITHTQKLTKGDFILLTVNLAFGELSKVRAQVRNVRKNPGSKNEPFVTGLEFFKPSPEQDKILRQFMETRLGERRGPQRP
ncbi:MAG: flagellar brake protein [Nitrospinota bacterium]|nr:flagellar brake protein [Nitrospinota bacterium]